MFNIEDNVGFIFIPSQEKIRAMHSVRNLLIWSVLDRYGENSEPSSGYGLLYDFVLFLRNVISSQIRSKMGASFEVSENQ